MSNPIFDTLSFQPFTVQYEDRHGLRVRAHSNVVRPGAVLRLKPKDERDEEHEEYPHTYVLVGNVNRILGECDDCPAFAWEDIEAVAYLPGFEEAA